MSSQTADGFEYRRCRALALRGQGWTQAQIAQALGVTQGAISQWEKAYHQHGRMGLVRQKAAGPIPRLDGFQRQRLLGLLSEGAQAVGFRGEVWTCARVRRVIQLAFGVVYHPAHISRLLRAWGWSVQKPFKRASQRDETAIEAWINARWPAIKKSAGTGRDDRVCGRVRVLPVAPGGADVRAAGPDAAAASVADS